MEKDNTVQPTKYNRKRQTRNTPHILQSKAITKQEIIPVSNIYFVSLCLLDKFLIFTIFTE